MNSKPSTQTQHDMQQAEQLVSQGKLANAEEIFRRIINQSPSFHPAYHSLGLVALKVDNLQLATELIDHAIQLDGSIALYQINLCEMLRRMGKLKKARVAGKKATSLASDNEGAWYNLGLVESDLKNWHSAEKAYMKVIQLNAQHNLAWNNLGTVLEKLNKQEEALGAYKKAIDIDPLHAEAQNNAGAIYSERGDLDEARQCFAAAIQAQPTFIEPYYNLSSLKTFTINDPHLYELDRLQNQIAELPLDAQIRFNFAHGKALEDIAEYDRAFAAYERGNDGILAQLNINETKTDAITDRIKEIFSTEFFKKLEDKGIDDVTPVFIVGMPRSGTTLIEQILSSHPDVYGAGELKELHKIVLSGSNIKNKGKFFEDISDDLKEFNFTGMAVEYLQFIRTLDQQVLRISDKMPANFFYIGFIHMMFPNAKIVHAMRDPMDSCFSCYSRLFNETMEFAYNLQTLGNYYVRYMNLMQHWHEVLPQGAILDLRYEEMVADVEGQSRRLIEYIQLPWDDNCLQFYNNKRQVKTASVAQVRKPIYNSSVARWQHFSKHLQPLKKIVEPYR